MMRYTKRPIRNLQIIWCGTRIGIMTNREIPGILVRRLILNYSLKKPLRDFVRRENRRSCSLHHDSVTPTDAGASFGSDDAGSPRGGVAEGNTQNMHLVHSSFPDQMWGTKKECYQISRGSNPCLNTLPNSLAIFGSSAHIGQV